MRELIQIKCTVHQMQSTESPLSGEVIEILLVTAYVSFVQDVPTATQKLPLLSYRSWESLQD